MATTLSDGTTTLTLPDDLVWVDEFEWRAVEASMSYSIAGALLVDRGVKLAGRPITLAGGMSHAWTTRTLIETLFAWSLLPSVQLTLNYRGEAHAVMFDHGKQPVEATPIVDYEQYVSADSYYATLRFLKKA